MAFVRNTKKPLRVVGALKQMKSRFLSKPEARMIFCQETKVIDNNIGDQLFHRKIILGKSYNTPTSHLYPPVNYCLTAKFHHLAENALIAWAMSNKNAEATFKPTGPEIISGLRTYAKEVDDKGAPQVDEKKAPHPMNADDSDIAERFAKAKRILKEKRMSKEMNIRRKSPFEEP